MEKSPSKKDLLEELQGLKRKQDAVKKEREALEAEEILSGAVASGNSEPEKENGPASRTPEEIEEDEREKADFNKALKEYEETTSNNSSPEPAKSGKKSNGGKEETPKTPEEELNVNARKEYFEIRTKKPKKGTSEQNAAYETELKEKKEAYATFKIKMVEIFLAKGETGKDQAREYLLREVEFKRKHDLENGLVGKKERIIAGVSNGIEKWDNWGKAKGMKGYLQRLAKTGVSLAMIGAISGLSVEGLAKMGIGTASALGGGITSYLGRRMGFGLGMSAIMAKVPDNKKKWVQTTLIAGSFGLAVVGGGLIAGGALVVASTVGLTLAKLSKKYDKKIGESMEKAKNGKINLDTLERDILEMERQMQIALRETEKARVWGKVREGAVALGGSIVALEAMGVAHDLDQHTAETKQHQPEIKAENAKAEQQHQADLKHEAEMKAQHDAELKTQQNTAATTSTPENIHPVSVTFEHGHGAIRGFQDFQKELDKIYPNHEDAPPHLRHILDTKPIDLAKEYKFYDPNHPNVESALIHEHSTLQLEKDGNVSFHDPRTGEGDILAQENNSATEHFHGNYSAHHEQVNHIAGNTSEAHAENNPYSNMFRSPHAPDNSPGEFSNKHAFQSINNHPFENSHPNSGRYDESHSFDKTHPFDKNTGGAENMPHGNAVKIPEGTEMKQLPDGSFGVFDKNGNQFIYDEKIGKFVPVEHPQTPVGAARAEVYKKFDQTKIPSINHRVGDTYWKDGAWYQITGIDSRGQENVNIVAGGSPYQNPFHPFAGEQAQHLFTLTPEQQFQVDGINQFNLFHIFTGEHFSGHQVGDWPEIKHMHPSSMLGHAKYENDLRYKPIMDYLHKLVETTGLKPRGRGLFRGAETVEHYIPQALKKAEFDGNIDKLIIK